jgi:hypothetical protein
MEVRAEQTKSTETSDRDGYFGAYEEYSKVVRTWLVAYGVGRPVLLFTNERISTAVANSPSAHWIAGLFLLWIDMVIDTGRLALFGIASFLAFRVVLH